MLRKYKLCVDVKNLIIVLLFFFTENIHAIVIRHDVNDREYIELGEKYSHSVAYIKGCASTLLNSNWLLTAAHCVSGRERDFFTVTHVESEYRIHNIIVHPKFDRTKDEIYDVALIQLKESIQNGRAAALYSKENEKGQSVVFIGKGTYGNGDVGLIKDDFKQRGATNTISEVSDMVIGFEFNSPEKATKLEGISSRGDSGGPAFIEKNSQLYIVGVSSYQEGNGITEGHYGVKEYYTRVSTVYRWIKETIQANLPVIIPKHALIDAMKMGDSKSLYNAVDNVMLRTDSISILNEVFYQSIKEDRVSLARYLIRAGVKIEDIKIKGISVFEFALINNRKKYYTMLQKEVRDKRIIHSKDSAVIALMIIKYSGLLDWGLLNKVKILVEQGANPNAITSYGETSLTAAVWNAKNINLVRFLVKKGASINVQNYNGDTPLMDAAYLGETQIVKFLLDNGADTAIKNNRGFTAIDKAKAQGNKKVEALINSYFSG